MKGSDPETGSIIAAKLGNKLLGPRLGLATRPAFCAGIFFAGVGRWALSPEATLPDVLCAEDFGKSSTAVVLEGSDSGFGGLCMLLVLEWIGTGPTSTSASGGVGDITVVASGPTAERRKLLIDSLNV